MSACELGAVWLLSFWRFTPTSGSSDGFTRRLCCLHTQDNQAIFFLKKEPSVLFSWHAAAPPLNSTLTGAIRVTVTASFVKGV